jgi:hypothetical protein
MKQEKLKEKTEKAWVDNFERYFEENHPRTKIFRGQGKKNSLSALNCKSNEYFQYGDFRVETDQRIIVVEIDTGRGIDNLVKYWPFLAGITAEKPEKEFSLLHVYGPSYRSNKELWRYLHSLTPRLAVPAEFKLITVKNWGIEERANVLKAIVRAAGFEYMKDDATGKKQ